MDPGFYGSASVSWRILRERALLLGGGRALLLQLAHPLVAAGVADHSTFRDAPLRRLERTLDLVLALVYGDRVTARRAASEVNAVHARVRGRLEDGRTYDARDPALLLWVHATLVDSTLATWDAFFSPLAEAERQRFYRESARSAELLGLAREKLPPDLAAFRCYVDDVLAGPELAVDGTAAKLADAVLHPPLPGVPRWLGDAASVVTVALLPPEVRALYGYRWDARRERIWRALRSALRAAIPLAPPPLRFVPQARAAGRRLALAADPHTAERSA